jgi:hypothetical protein
MQITPDSLNQRRKVSTFINHVASYSVLQEEPVDIPLAKVEINWVPSWSAFVWFNAGRVILKVDESYN